MVVNNIKLEDDLIKMEEIWVLVVEVFLCNVLDSFFVLMLRFCFMVLIFVCNIELLIMIWFLVFLQGYVYIVNNNDSY